MAGFGGEKSLEPTFVDQNKSSFDWMSRPWTRQQHTQQASVGPGATAQTRNRELQRRSIPRKMSDEALKQQYSLLCAIHRRDQHETRRENSPTRGRQHSFRSRIQVNTQNLKSRFS